MSGSQPDLRESQECQAHSLTYGRFFRARVMLAYRFRAAMNDARTRISFFSAAEFGIRQVRTALPRVKYWR